MKIYTGPQDKKFKTLKQFCRYLGEFKKDCLINTGLASIWENHTIPSSNDILDSFGSRIILLSLAAQNNSGRKDVSKQDFNQLCNDYVNIHDFPVDVQELIRSLKSISTSENPIPEEFINKITLHSLEAIRVFKSNNLRIRKKGLEKYLWTSWKLLKNIDNKHKDVLKSKLPIHPLHFMRSCLALLHFAQTGNGLIDFSLTSFNDECVKRFHIDEETCRLVAFRLSYDESKLSDWLLEKIKPIKEKDQKYFPNLFATFPLIHMDKDFSQKEIFLMPSPRLFLYAASQYLFKTLDEEDEGFNAKFGEVIENHIYDVLFGIFGNKLQRIEKTTEKRIKIADFIVELDNYTLIFEIKKQIAPYDDRSIMGERNIVKLWTELYYTCHQLASPSNLDKIADKTKPIIPIILFYEFLELEHMPFQLFAESSGLFKSLGLNLVEFFSWSDFERFLAETSADKLVEKLLERSQKVGSMSVGDVIDFTPDCDNNPAHCYEYLTQFEGEFLSQSTEL